MQKYGIPITKKNWLEFIYPDGPPPEGWQNEEEIPVEFQNEE